MFEGLNWSSAFKRAAIFTGIWLGLVYVMHAINPQLFRLGDSSSFLTLALNAVLFFFLYAVFFAFIERRRNRLRTEAKAGGKSKASGNKPAGDGEEAPSGALKGQRNPNTSRKKATRRRR
jgi:hypothetical protein